MFQYQLKTSLGLRVWEGNDGLDACRRWADANPGESVYAWREWPRVGVVAVYKPEIVE